MQVYLVVTTDSSVSLERGISYKLKPFLYQTTNLFISAVNFGILTRGSMGIDLFLATSGHLRNCFWHLYTQMLVLDRINL